jgi:hypothetical protein
LIRQSNGPVALARRILRYAPACRIVTNEMVEPVTRVLLGSIDTGDGGTEATGGAACPGGRVLSAWISTSARCRADFEEAAATVTDPRIGEVCELMVLLESPAPLTEEQVAPRPTPRRCTRRANGHHPRLGQRRRSTRWRTTSGSSTRSVG